MTIFEQLTEDMKIALKAGEKDRLSTIRLLRGQIKNAMIDKGEDLTEKEELLILNNAAKKRRESIEAYKAAGRTDLVEKEEKELGVIESYLPEQLGEAELEKIIDQVIDDVEAVTIKDLGKVMPAVMSKVQGRADGKKVNELVRQKLG
ncbi:GatB/YqeY domain-containing protein [candidate division KSB1 bacterium]|nr:GatB/YqeY domain-containing protein [candidate division KSB1 bacterium]